MVSFTHVLTTNAQLYQSQPLVAVFVGATSGIGQYSLKALARSHASSGKGLRAYIVGRNAAAAERSKYFLGAIFSHPSILNVFPRIRAWV